MKLRHWLSENEKSIAEFSKQIECDADYMCRIVNQRLIAGKRLAKEIERSTEGEVTAEYLRSLKIKTSRRSLKI